MLREFSKKNAKAKVEPVPDHFDDEETHVVGRNKCFMEVKRQIDIRNKTYLEEKVSGQILRLEIEIMRRNIIRCKKMRFLGIGRGLTAKMRLFSMTSCIFLRLNIFSKMAWQRVLSNVSTMHWVGLSILFCISKIIFIDNDNK